MSCVFVLVSGYLDNTAGPMSLVIAAPSNEGLLDETENFQFENGTQFNLFIKTTKFTYKSEFTDKIPMGRIMKFLKTLLSLL